MTDAITSGLLSQTDYYVRSAVKHVQFAKTAQLRDTAVRDVWFSPAENSVIIRKEGASEIGVRVKLASADTPVQDYWCGLAIVGNTDYFPEAREIADRMMGFPKYAEKSTAAQKAYSLLGFDDRYYPTNPVAAMLATGILGAGLGYGGASLASSVLPKSWDKKKFRRSGLLLGGAVGAAPGALETVKSLMIGQPVLDGSHMKRKVAKTGDYPMVPAPRYSALPQISGDELMKMTWQHPLVSHQLTQGQQALISGAVHGATAISNSPFFTPNDMARLTAGMGSGYATGLVSGKVLGTLTGLPQSVQNTLANTGALAGALKATLPLIYGR